jgi:hypothetical protein
VSVTAGRSLPEYVAPVSTAEYAAELVAARGGGEPVAVGSAGAGAPVTVGGGPVAARRGSADAPDRDTWTAGS